MIDINKQYTYNGKLVRIYADGSDTVGGIIHFAYLNDFEKWTSMSAEESDLVEVWQPKEGELCYFWDTWHYLVIDKFKAYYSQDATPFKTYFGIKYLNCAPFKGELPEAFKGLV